LRLKLDTMQTGYRLVNRFVRRIKLFSPFSRLKSGRKLPICGTATRFPRHAIGIVDKARKRQENSSNSAAKQRLTVKAGRAYNPRLPETAGTTSSVDVALRVVFALEGWT